MTKSGDRSSTNFPFYLLLTIFGLYLAARLVGAYLFDNNWSFTHWQHLPLWYLVPSGLFVAGIAWLLLKRIDVVAAFFADRRKALVGSLLLMALLVIFQFDSFLYGGGNYTVAQVAQTDTIILRWFEYGSLLLASKAFKLLSLLGIEANTAGVIGWKSLTFVSAGLTLIASLKIAREATESNALRLLYFLLMFFGPQAVLYFGFVGLEPMLVAVIYWFALIAFRLNRKLTTNRLLTLWLVTAIGLLVHVSLVLLVPAMLFVTARALRLRTSIALVIALIAYVTLLAIVFDNASANLEYARRVLFLSDMNLQEGYSLFSPRHLGDIAQLLFLFAPQLLLLKYFFYGNPNRVNADGNVITTILLMTAGATVMVIVEPLRGIAFEAPRLAAYLAPVALTIFAYINAWKANDRIRIRLAATLAVVSLAVTLAVLPSYTRIALADPYLTDYLDKNEYHNLEGCTAFRDAYFYRKQLDPANRWEWSLSSRSQTFMQLKAAKEYIAAEMYSQALTILYRVKTEHRFLTEPRYLIGIVQRSLKRFDAARPEIDTCLLMDPYNRDFLISDYRYYRDDQNVAEAVRRVELALEIYPGDIDMMVDKMIFLYRAGAFDRAEPLAMELVENEPSQAYPWLIKGFIAQQRGNVSAAIECYETFISLAPEEAETPQVRKQLNQLVVERQGKAKD